MLGPLALVPLEALPLPDVDEAGRVVEEAHPLLVLPLLSHLVPGCTGGRWPGDQVMRWPGGQVDW